MVTASARQLLVYLLLEGAAGFASTLVGTRWRVKLDVGLEDGSWMPKTVEGWGASGARVIVNVDVDFDEALLGEGEDLVGPQAQTRVLTARNASTIVTARGEEQMAFASGGWCVQRTYGSRAEDEGELRFWLDCESGCARNDVSVPAGERIFFCTSAWDDAAGLKAMARERADLAERLRAAEEAADAAFAAPSDGLLGKALSFREKIATSETLDSLRAQSAFYERQMPTLGDDERPAQVAPGSLSVKRTSGSGLFARKAYHILGRFSVEPLPN